MAAATPPEMSTVAAAVTDCEELMKAFLVASGIIFGLIVIAHIARMTVETHLARDPWFLLLTLVAAGLSGWAWVLVLRSRKT